MFRFMGYPLLAAMLLLTGCSLMQPQTRQEAPRKASQKEEPSAERPGRPPERKTASRPEKRADKKDSEETTPEETEEKDSGAVKSEKADASDSEEEVDEVTFGTKRLALTEALGRAQERVKIQKEKIGELEKKLEETRSELKSVRTERDNLQGKMATYKKQLAQFEKEMKKWKKDVLGFRDEIRHSEEAEMQALKQIIILLRKASNKTKTSEKPETGEGENSE